ncbi:MAG: Omp28-related outer membrane protein [Bacteroidales bacterium]|nr:Omp28-related outer membrane protein [Bacteroidales bacterium]MDD3989519.1 Omp28-related outer membrane protein [Bacteroidales bacterium]MDD4638734.1 Omp28-related outer membrane protein [Bacteroidales bacterium]
MKSSGRRLTVYLAIFILTLFGCAKESGNQPDETIPTVETNSVSGISATDALGGGFVSKDGGQTVKAKGLCWSTSPQPVVTGSKSVDGGGTGNFSTIITGLTPGTTYYVRAYATNNNGTAYGNEYSFVTAASNPEFEKNVLLEQYTGTWCGWCTRAISQIDNLYAVNKKVVHIALHLSDQMTFSQNNSLFTSFGFTGVPTVHADRTATWTGSATAISYMQEPVDFGLAINVEGSGTSVNVTVRAKFGINTAEVLKISVYMLEDGIIANQSNNYNTDVSHPFYGMGNPIPNFVHNNVLVKIGTDMFGDLIPSGEVRAGNIYSKSYSFTNIASEKLGKLKVAAFLSYNTGFRKKQVINAVVASVGENKDFVEI